MSAPPGETVGMTEDISREFPQPAAVYAAIAAAKGWNTPVGYRAGSRRMGLLDAMTKLNRFGSWGATSKFLWDPSARVLRPTAVVYAGEKDEFRWVLTPGSPAELLRAPGVCVPGIGTTPLDVVGAASRFASEVLHTSQENSYRSLARARLTHPNATFLHGEPHRPGVAELAGDPDIAALAQDLHDKSALFAESFWRGLLGTQPKMGRKAITLE